MRRHIEKPRCGIDIIPGHPLSKGLTLCLPFNERTGHMVRDYGPYHLHNSAYNRTSFDFFDGGLRQYSSSGESCSFSEEKVMRTGNMTFVVWIKKISLTERYGFINAGPTGSSRCTITCGYFTVPQMRLWFGDSFFLSHNISLPDDDIYIFSAGPRGVEFFVNGELVNSSATNPSRSMGSNAEFQIGTFSPDNSGGLIVWHAVYVYARQLSIGEIKELSVNPFVMFPPSLPYIMTSNPPPTANFSATPLSGERPTTIDFNDLSTGEVSSWQWDFEADGVTDTGSENPSYAYPNAGTYSVRLTVSGPYGTGTTTKTNYITITEPLDHVYALKRRQDDYIATNMSGSYNTKIDLDMYDVEEI